MNKQLQISNNETFMGKALKIRAFETHLLDLFSKNMVGGTTHTCIGQELSGVIVGHFLTEHDIVIRNHRCHGHYLGLTEDFLGLAQELLGNESGFIKELVVLNIWLLKTDSTQMAFKGEWFRS